MSSVLSSIRSNSAQWATEERELGTNVRPRGSHIEWRPSAREPARVGRILARFLATFCIGVVATLAWQSYGDPVREIIAGFSPRLGWFAPPGALEAAPAPAAADQEELKSISLGLAGLQQRVDQMVGEITAGQEEMRRDIANKLQSAEQEILEKVSPPAQRPAAPPARKP